MNGRTAIAAVALLLAAPAKAQEARREAQEALERGRVVMEDLPAEGTSERAGRCGEAAGHFERSIAAHRTESAVYQLARALYCQRRYVAAIGALEGLLADPRFRQVASARGSVSRAQLEGAVAQWRELLVALRPGPSDAAVTVDGQAVAASSDGAFRFDPGDRVVEVRAEGRASQRLERAFAEGERLSFTLGVLPAAAEPPRVTSPVVTTLAAGRRAMPAASAAPVNRAPSDVLVTQPPPEERRARWILPVAIGAGVAVVAGAVVAAVLLADPGGIAPPPPQPGMLGGPYATRP